MNPETKTDNVVEEDKNPLQVTESKEVSADQKDNDNDNDDNQLEKVEIATTPSTEVVSADNCLVVRIIVI